MANDPITLVHEAAWAQFEAVPEMAALVQPANRIKLDHRDDLKASVQDGDLPEIILVPRAGAGNLTFNSSNVSLEITFDWLISTGDYRLSYRLGPVLWNLFRVMSKFQQSAGSLQWDSKPFINSVVLNSASIGESDTERNRGIRGFSSAMNFTVKMFFPRGSF